MRLTKQQRKQRAPEIRRAINGAIIAHFTGVGAFGRIQGVIGRFILAFLFWAIVTASFIVATVAVLAWLAIETDHARFLLAAHSVLEKGGYQEVRTGGMHVLITALEWGASVGVSAGIIKALVPIADPARDAVIDKWRKTDDETGATA